jgi:hypothetical protein
MVASVTAEDGMRKGKLNAPHPRSTAGFAQPAGCGGAK